MGNILSRVKQIADYEGLTVTSLEAKIGASKGVLSRAIKNNTDIQSKWLSKVVENYPHFNSNWLLKGEGDMLNLGAENPPHSDFPLVGERFSKYLERKGLSGNKAANLLGETEGQISNILKGQNFYCDKMFNILSVFKDLDANYLFRGSGTMIIGSAEPEKASEDPEMSKTLITAQQELIKYKDSEIKALKQEISQLKKEYKQENTHLRVAESDPKLK